MYLTYCVWMQRHGEDHWRKTHHTVKARTDKEAQSRVKRMFAGCGLSGIALFAVLIDNDPNTGEAK